MKHILFSTIFLFCVSFLWAQTPTDEEKLERYNQLLTTKQKQITVEQNLKQKKEDSLTTFSQNLQKTEKELATQNDTLASIEKNLNKTRSSLDKTNATLKTKKETLETTKKELEDAQQKRSANQASLSKVTSQLQTDKSDLQVHKKQLTDFQEKVDLVEKKIGVNDNSLTTKKQSLSDKKTQIKTTRENLSTQQKKLEELKSKAKTIDENVTVAKSDISTKFQKVNDLNTSVTNSSNSLSNQIQQLEENDKNIKVKTSEIVNIKKQLDTEEQKLKNTLSKIEVQNIQQKVNSLHTKQTTLFTEVITINNKIKAIGIEVETTIQRLQGLEKNKILATNDLTHSHEILLNIEEEKKNLSSNVTNVSLEVDRLNKEETALQYDIQKLDADIAALAKEKVELAKEKDWVTVKRNEEKALVEKLTISVGELETKEKELNSSIKISDEKISSNQTTIDTLNKEIPTLESTIKTLTSSQESLTEKEKVITKEKENTTEIADKLKVVKTRLESELVILRSNANIAEIILQGLNLGLKGEFKQAISTFKKAANQEEKNREPHYLNAYSEYILKDYKTALKELEKAIVIDERYIDAYLLKAEINEARGHYIGAIDDYNIINSLNPKHIKSFDHKGRIYHDFLMEWDLACQNWDKAIALGSSFAQNEKERHCNIPLIERRYRINQITEMAKDASYGYSETKPISVGRKDDLRENRKENIESYLNLLRDPRGHKVEYRRMRSCCPYDSKSDISLGGKALVEEYEVVHKDLLGKKIVKMLYFTFYEYERPLVPLEFKTTFELK